MQVVNGNDRELPVLRVVGVGDDLHGGDNIGRQIHRRTSGNRIGDVGAVHQRPALRAACTFHADMAVRSTDDSGNHRQGAFKALVHVRSIAERLLGNRFGRGRDLRFAHICRYRHSALHFGGF